MKTKSIGILLFILAASLMVAQVNAQEVLYGADGASTLYTIAPSTGVATPIGPMGFAKATGLAAHPTTGALYATPGGGGCCPQAVSGCLYSVNKTTGAATQIGCDPVQGGNDPFPGLSFHSDGTLYGIRLAVNAAPADGNMYLATIDTITGIMTDIGMSRLWCEGFGLSFLPDDTLYTWDTCVGLSRLSLIDGSATPIGFGSFFGFPEPVVAPYVPSMDANAGGALYGILYDGGNGNRYLVTINPVNGDMIYVSTLPDGMQNIAFVGEPGHPSVPTMTEWGMIILSLLLIGIGYFAIRRRQRASV